MRTRFLASLGTLFTSTALAFSQVPSGYYPAYPAASPYGNYPAYSTVPGYGYGYPAGYPYAVTYDYDTSTAVPTAPQATKTPAQPMPPGKSAPEVLPAPKESKAQTTPSSQGGGTVAPGSVDSTPADAGDQGPGWADRFSSFDLHPHGWVSADYMRWFLRRQPLPIPLVTTGSPVAPVPGALGQPGTQIVYGGDLPERSFNGYRAEIGTWLDDNHCWGVQASGFVLPKYTTSALSIASDPNGNPPLYIPVFRTDLNMERSVTISDPVAVLNPPGPITGFFTVPMYSQLWGLELNAIAGNICKCESARLDFLVGVRYLDLREGLEFDLQQNAVNQGITTQLFDRFSTSNRFYGGQVGAHGSVECSILSLELTGKIALGCTHESSVISGATTVTGPGVAVPPGPGTFAGGIFTTPSNIRRLATDVFAVVPQVQARVGVRVTDMVKLYAAYDVLYWSDTVRPGNQINRNVNFTELLGGPVVGAPGASPSLNNSTFFWAQGVSVGMEISF
jgi:hypothetical protein